MAMITFRQLIKTASPLMWAKLKFNERLHHNIITKNEDGNTIKIETDEDMLLSDGDMLLSSEGIVLAIEAANEEVTTVVADKITLQKIIYFLGERHTFIEIKDSFIRYLPQKELDEEIRKMGGKIFYEKVKFNPEPMTLKRF